MEASTSSEVKFQILANSHIPLSISSGDEVESAISRFTRSLGSVGSYGTFQPQVQLLTALFPRYEAIRGDIFHRSPIPSMDAIVHELLYEKTRLKITSQTSSPSSRAPTQSSFQPPTVYTASTQASGPNLQILSTSQSSSSASALTSLHSSLLGSSSVSKEDLVHMDPFPSEIPADEYISTVSLKLVPSSPPSTPSMEYLSIDPPEAIPISSLATSTPSLSPLLVYSCRKAPPQLVVSTPVAASSASEDSNPAVPGYPTRECHPPNRLGRVGLIHVFLLLVILVLSAIHSSSERQSYKKACQDPNWVQAMEDELSAL
ncbi:hypothetical protein CsSME_00012389 [Camellia sinensis var. sinensis]